MAQQTQQPIGQINHQTQQQATAQGTAAGLVTLHGGSQPVNIQWGTLQLTYSQKEARSSVALGVIRILAGLLCIIFQSAAISIEKTFLSTFRSLDNHYSGIWCGFVFIICGILGICSAKKCTKNLITSFMIFSLLSSMVVWYLVGFAAANLSSTNNCSSRLVSSMASRTAFDSAYKQFSATGYNIFGTPYVYYYSVRTPNYYIQYFSVYQYSNSKCSSPQLSTWKAMDALLLILAILEFAVGLAAWINCCKAIGCCCQPQPASTIQQALSSPPTANVVIQGYGSPLMYQGQGVEIQQAIGEAQPVQSVAGVPPYGVQPFPQHYGMQTSVHVSVPARVFHTEGAGDVNLQDSNGYQPQASTSSLPEYMDLGMPPSYDDVCKADLKE